MQEGSKNNTGTISAPPEMAPAPWREFVTTDSPAEFARIWLQHLLSQLPSVESAVVMMLRSETGKLVSAAHWPAERPVDLALNAVVEAATQRKQAVVLPLAEESGAEASQLCYPVEIAGQVIALTAVKLATADEQLLENGMRQLRWSSSWLELFYRRRHGGSVSSQQDELVLLLSVVASALEHSSFQGASMSAVNELAAALGCTRVSLGTNSKGFCAVQAVSGTSDFSGKVQLLQSVGRAMDEAVDQQASVLHPNFDDASVLLNNAQQELAGAEEAAGHAVCTLPLPGAGYYFGALTLEWPEGHSFSESELEQLELIVVVLGPILEDKRRAELSWWRRALDAMRNQAVSLFGPRYYVRKSFAVVTVLILLFFSFYHADYQVTADARLESTVLQAIVAPVDGFVESADVRAGDLISAGQALYQLDDRDLKLEQLRWSSEALQLERQMRDAVALRQPAKVRVLEAQLEQARAQLALANEQLGRMRATAPFDGVVISGDLSQSLGAPVNRGDILFEITPLDEYRVALMVDEQDIGSLAVGQEGKVVLRSGSESGLGLVVERVVPLAEPWDGRNVFRVECRLQDVPDYLRPGMEGIGKVEAGQRRLIWIWTHKFTRWLRLALWEWF
jgi:RND family efflux transporter MFP subunit